MTSKYDAEAEGHTGTMEAVGSLDALLEVVRESVGEGMETIEITAIGED